MIVVYLAGPFRGHNAYEVYRNVQMAEAVMHEVILRGQAHNVNLAVLCPHSMSAHFDKTFTDQYWIDATLELLRRCDRVLMLRGWEKSVGALGEKAEAERRSIPVYTTLDDLMIAILESLR